jgi:hypothetical protein
LRTTLQARRLSQPLLLLLQVAAAIDVLVGLLFLFGPELQFSVWPTTVAPLLMRFIGAIVLANAVGLWIGVRQGTWEGLRALFWVGVVYGALALLALLYHLLIAGAPPIFWAYAAADFAYLVGIAAILWIHERAA